MGSMDQVPDLRLSSAVGAPIVTLIGVDPLTPETFHLETATEDVERAQAAVNQRRYEGSMEQLIARACLTAEGEG